MPLMHYYGKRIYAQRNRDRSNCAFGINLVAGFRCGRMESKSENNMQKSQKKVNGRKRKRKGREKCIHNHMNVGQYLANMHT